ncbi:MAG: hypothetical protein JNL05_05005 [Flavobacteriales bacterium]|nr:hypothetical protein [Flavobacteriales bacterium]
MDYRIRRSPDDLESTGFVEIYPWKDSGDSWQHGGLFIREDAFNVAEGIVMRHQPGFDHLSSNDIPRSVGMAIVADWRSVADRLPSLSPIEAATELNLDDWFVEGFLSEFANHRSEIVAMLRDLAQECRQFYGQSKWVCIIGM